MMTVEQLVKVFKELREGQGITVSKLQNRPYLLAEFNIETPAEFITFMEEATVPLMSNPNCKAALVALAVGYEPMKDLTSRRLHHAGVSSKAFGDAQQNIRRNEDKGFKEIATLLLDSGRKRVDSRNLYERIEKLEASVRVLSSTVQEILRYAPITEKDALSKKLDKYKGELRRPLGEGEVPLFEDDFLITSPILTAKVDPELFEAMLQRLRAIEGVLEENGIALPWSKPSSGSQLDRD